MNNYKKKVLFILPSLAAGGAERVMSFVAQNINAKQFDSHLLIITDKSEAAFVYDEKRTTFLNKKRVLYAIPALFIFLVKHKPNIVVSCISHLNTIMALLSVFFKKTKFIAREATVSGKRKKTKHIKETFYNLLAKFTYPLIDVIVCQSTDMKNDLLINFSIPEEKVLIINNPVTNINVNRKKNKINYKGTINYITVGRLADVKGHLRILKLLSKLSFDFKYLIIGEGPRKKDVFDAIQNYGLNEKINYIPYTNEVAKYLINSDIFLQGSYVEGFPNSVLESCAVGTPVIAFDAPGGTKEIIENGVNGYISVNEEDFFNKLCLKQDWDSNTIINSVQKKFGKDIILKQYTNLFNTI